MKNEFHKMINANSGNNLLIIILIGKKKSNILLFKEEDKKLIVPNEIERKILEDFYEKIDFKNIEDQCSSLNDLLFNEKVLFGIPIISKTYEEKRDVYNSFINQGINCLLENHIF